jgi:hypothetical protein
VDYACEVSVRGKRQKLRSRRAFEQKYRSIICKPVREVILAQKFDALFANYNGFMIGNGGVWFSGVCQDAGCHAHRIRIIAIDGPFASKCP